jgi:hypothetical protein
MVVDFPAPFDTKITGNYEGSMKIDLPLTCILIFKQIDYKL